MNYQEFLRRKAIVPIVSGLSTVPELHSAMFPHQRDVCAWALRLGRSAAFLGTGMGKTLIELEWARVVSEHTNLPVLILAPLAVAQQTIREASKFGLKAEYHKTSPENPIGIVVSNYERLENFNPDDFAGVVLDESSILKSFDGKTRSALIDAFKSTPYKLCGTATPAPNDYMELGNHAEFLGVMTATEMLSMFFVHDGGETQKWRLKGHARKEFWKWVCSWAVSMRKPSDIGYSDDGFELPDLVHHHHIVNVETPSDGMLFAMPAQTLQERIGARRSSQTERIEACLEIVNSEPMSQWIIWCNLNSEQDEIARRLGDDCVSIYGSLSPDEKVSRLSRWLDGDARVLVSKSSIFGFGLNFQQCSRIAFVGVNDSWEQFYQAERRCWRFGQTKSVHSHIIAASTEGNVIENLNRKEEEAQQMADEMAANTQDLTRMNLRGTIRTASPYHRDVAEGKNWTMHLADCVDLAQELPDNSIHFSVYSPPFESLYTYSNSERDMGNSKSTDEFWEHYQFLIHETYRVMMEGRLVSVHCMNLPTSKVRDGVIGIRDFRGEIIRAFEKEGFIYHSEVCIWKDPVTAMQRTKALGLLHKQIKKDSCMSRQGIPDYLVTFRKPGDNAERVTNNDETFPVRLWQEYASPIWTDINPSDTLQHRSAREHEDERHICPLQLEVIRRAIKLWSNEHDLVWSPFSGIGSEGVVAIEMGRRFIGSELKQSYWRQAVKNLTTAHHLNQTLFDEPEERTILGEPVRLPVGAVMGAEPLGTPVSADNEALRNSPLAVR
jgi:DNA modification methylase